MNHAVAVKPSGALTVPRQDLIRVLGNSLYPGAAEESIALVLGYCEATGLDPMLKPVHIVPMWDSKAKRMRDVIMPGVNSHRVAASRTNQFAGMSEPEFGPTIDRTFREKDGGAFTLSYPEWCRVTVRRQLPSGIVAEFPAVEYWEENYATAGRDTDAPNAMWRRRIRGQLAKCAEAQALRKAFPELAAALTAEEMEGKPLDPNDGAHDVIEAVPPDLLNAARDAADKGRAGFEAFWKPLPKETRMLFQHELDALKVRTEAAEERIAEAAASQMPNAVRPGPATATAQAESGPVGAQTAVAEGQVTPPGSGPAAVDPWVLDMERAETGSDAPDDSAPHAKGARGAKR
jgi:phage recombination protein Bet